MDVSSNEFEEIQSSNSEGLNFSLSDPIDLGSNKEEVKKAEKTRRSSENEKHPMNLASKPFFAPKTNKKVLHNPFKKPKIENDISVFFTQHSQKTSTIQDAIKKAEDKNNSHNQLSESELRKEYELDFYRSYKQDQKQQREEAAKSKFSNPWKDDKSSNFIDMFDSKEDKRNLFNPKPLKNTATENCNNKNPKFPFDNAEKQHSTKLNTFKSYNNKNNNIKKDEEEERNDAKPINNPLAAFRTGHQELEWQKNLQKKPPQRGLSKKRPLTNVIEQPQMPNSNTDPLRKRFHCPSFPKANENKKKEEEDSEDVHDDLKGFDKEILKRIEREIVIDSKEVSWDDIIGLEGAKKVIKESVILAIRRPDLFTGLRESSRAIMLFGPPVCLYLPRFYIEHAN
jgi:SpoVK/Ycf46/Vps4 family AAA+-type ATPase